MSRTAMESAIAGAAEVSLSRPTPDKRESRKLGLAPFREEDMRGSRLLFAPPAERVDEAERRSQVGLPLDRHVGIEIGSAKVFYFRPQ